MKKKTLQISPVKGRPMLHWVGKKPQDTVRYFPAQLCEAVGVDRPPTDPTYEKFARADYNLLFHGDNKEVLSSLIVSGFRGKVDLIYIDPPFDSGADYVRRVKLRDPNNANGNGHSNGGANGNGGIEGAGHTSIERAQYEDIWANDNYLQFMYERLILLRELLSDKGGIYLHCDWHKSHYLRFLLDEVFGADHFKNEISWKKTNSPKAQSSEFGNQKDHIFYYAKSADNVIFENVYTEMTESALRPYRYDDSDGKGKYRLIEIEAQGVQRSVDRKQFEFKGVTAPYLYKKETLDEWDREGKIYVSSSGRYSKKQYLSEVQGIPASDLWVDQQVAPIQSSEYIGYPTQKPEALLERIIRASSNPDSIVLDCFCGSGTTAAVAEKFGRRWIMADINRGAIQTTIKRIQGIAKQTNGNLESSHRGLIHYRVNNYNFADQHELAKIIVTKYGIEKINRMEGFFDGVVGGNLAKIISLDKPLTRLDIQMIKDEVANNRVDEIRDITVFCNGAEFGIVEELSREKSPINKIMVVDIQQDGLITDQPAQADVTIKKQGKKVKIKIADYISPSILARMKSDRTLFYERFDDFRAQIDCVLIDIDYNGKHFNIVHSDIPKRKTDYIIGEYALPLPRAAAKVAVKIVDMLGEETLIVK